MVIGALVTALCLADSPGGELADSGDAVQAARTAPLVTSASKYFETAPRPGGTPVTASGTARRMWADQKQIWTSPFRLRRKDLQWLVPLAAATGVLIGTDHHTMTLLHSDPRNRNLSTEISNAGLAGFAFAGATAFGLGTIHGDEHAREAGILTGEAVADSFFLSEALKLVSERTRPDTSDARGGFWQGAGLNSSFPSQHSAMAWAAATVFAREYPGPVTKWSAYGLASLVGVSRILADQHFPSDVLVGAAAGYLVGRYVYHAHHNDELSDRTGATPTSEIAKRFATSLRRAVAETHATGPVYVPLDSWIYPALRRLAALGFIPDQVSDSAPWTRAECLRQVEQASQAVSKPDTAERDRAARQEALLLIRDLESTLDNGYDGENLIRLESAYTRFTEIAGRPLRDSYHFGQTVSNDFGRPYDQGFNYLSGFSSYAASGRFSAYVRGEYASAPGRDSDPLAVRSFLSRADGTPLQSSNAIAATNRFQPLEMYAGVQLGPENITFGKQSLWWGPGEQSAFSFSDNAEPFYMLRLSQSTPLVLPGPFARLGKLRTEIIFGKLSGHSWPPRPFINAQKITLDVTDDLEVGFTRSAIFGGVGHPLTLGTLKESLFSFSSVDRGPYGSADLPGDRHSGFDFRWRVPGLRRYLTVYSDSFADDEPNPLDNPKRSAWAPGLYVSRLPGLRHLDFHLETYATWLYRKDQGGEFLYWDNQYRDSYTNNGNLLGSWVGRDSRAYTAEAAYWFSAKSKLVGQYRQIKAASGFLPGGGTQTDVSVTAQWAIGAQWLISSEIQQERYYVPILGPARRDTLSSLQLTFNPANWTIH